MLPLRKRPPIPAVQPHENLQARPFLSPAFPELSAGEISFLNVVAPLHPGSIDWEARDRSKLWRYNLHYFDFLHWPGLSPSAKASAIDDWIRNVAVLAGDGWEPYPVSLRVVNWIKYSLMGEQTDPPQKFYESLALQLAILEGQVEYHLLANHLLKNAKALIFGGVFFRGAPAVRWLELGMKILRKELPEQILADGGHFERSPMYHSIVLEDLLDIVNLLESNPGMVEGAQLRTVREVAARAAGFLVEMTAANGHFGLFNDSAYGIVREPDALVDYARSILGSAAARWPPPDGVVKLAASGYFGWRSGGDSFIIDCGPVGPDYQPGHGHCDLLSYELCIAGHAIVVDSGVHDYEGSALRHYVRSTAAHNTIRVDGEEQSEIWGAFRIARRAKPLSATIRLGSGGGWEFIGAHDGYRRLRGKLVHERRVSGTDGRWLIADSIKGRDSGVHLIESYIHLHPGCSVVRDGHNAVIVQVQDRPVCRISPKGDQQFLMEEGCYCPRFGHLERNQVLLFREEMTIPAVLSYEIEAL